MSREDLIHMIYDHKDAIKLIVNGFANEIINKISIDNISSFLQKKITTILEKRVK